MNSLTAWRMTSGEVLKYRNGKHLVIPGRYSPIVCTSRQVILTGPTRARSDVGEGRMARLGLPAFDKLIATKGRKFCMPFRMEWRASVIGESLQSILHLLNSPIGDRQ